MSTGTIINLSNGGRGIVREVNADPVIRQRLFDMGIIPNIEVTKVRAVIGGDPVWIKVGTVEIALRRNEAEAVVVELV